MNASLKTKYHADRKRTVRYAAREHEAYAMLLRQLGPYYTVVFNGFASGQVGVREGGSEGSEGRFDFAIASVFDRRKVYCFVEVTGDNVNDTYAYVLSEKVRKALELPVPVFIMYRKERKNMWRVYSAKYIAKHGELVEFVKGEKPYYRVMLSKGWTFRDWCTWLRNHYIPGAVRNKKYIVMQTLPQHAQ